MNERLRLAVEAMNAFANSAPDDRAVAATVADHVGRLLRSYCLISLISPDGDWLEQVASAAPTPELAEQLPSLAPSLRSPLSFPGISHGVARGGPEVWYPDLDRTEARAAFAAPFAGWIDRFGLGSLLCVPLRARDVRIGALIAARPKAAGAPLRLDDLRLASILAEQAGLAMSNARTLRESERLARRAQFLSDTSRELAAAHDDLPRLLELVSRRCSEGLGLGCSGAEDLCVLRLVDPSGTTLEPAGGSWHPQESVRRAARELMRDPYPVGSGIAGQVAATGRAVVLPRVDVEQVAAASLPVFRSFVREVGISSLLAVPLVAGGKVIGVLNASRNRPDAPYTEADVALVRDFSDHAALAIANSRLLATALRELRERERAEAELRHTQEQLFQSQRLESIGRLAGGIAHDFNNLLSVILSYADLVQADLGVDHPSSEDLREIAAAGARAASLTQQLLAFGRRQMLAPRAVDLNAVITSMSSMLQRLVGDDVLLQTIPGAHLGTAVVDPSHIEQIVMNLVVNARDAMPEGGTVVIETAALNLDASYAHAGLPPGPHVMLAVSDTGHGMEPATVTQIFEPFFTTKELGKGTGLGLSTVYGIVKQNGGSIWVYSEVGAGTTFKVYFPRSDAAATDPIPATAAAPPVGGTETVLLVEDDPQVRKLVCGVLSRSGYRVVDFGHPTDALTGAPTVERVDLLLTDVVMPTMNGRALAERVLATRPEARVLYMSGFTENSVVRQRVLDPGFVMLEKPITPDRLLRKVRQVLDAPRG